MDENQKRALDNNVKRIQAYKHLFMDGKELSPNGKKVITDLARLCCAIEPSFVPGEPDYTSFNEGKRFVFNRIMAHLQMDISVIHKLNEEAEYE